MAYNVHLGTSGSQGRERRQWQERSKGRQGMGRYTRPAGTTRTIGTYGLKPVFKILEMMAGIESLLIACRRTFFHCVALWSC